MCVDHLHARWVGAVFNVCISGIALLLPYGFAASHYNDLYKWTRWYTHTHTRSREKKQRDRVRMREQGTDTKTDRKVDS